MTANDAVRRLQGRLLQRTRTQALGQLASGLPGAERQRVVVEAEAPRARGRFTLLLWQDGEPPGVSLEGVTFP
ncbi:MAG TPA: hypothetical protein VFZ09_40540 [Archangium sp.]|nr:hypothetical protein [Archangium sp.]HEX5752564.1 hypothetical protein [Archangium sp.]